MMKEEFEKRIGLEINYDEYIEIEPLYLNDPKNRDKDAFCKHWLKDGGLQWLFDKRQGVINLAEARIRLLDEKLAFYENWRSEVQKDADNKTKRIEELEMTLDAIRQLVS